MLVQVLNGASYSDIADARNLSRDRVMNVVCKACLDYFPVIYSKAIDETRLRAGTFRVLHPSVEVLRMLKDDMLN